MHIRKWNYQLFLDHQVLEGEKVTLSSSLQDNNTSKQILLDAVSCLCLKSYQTFKSIVKESKYLLKDKIVHDNGSFHYAVHDIRYPDAPPREFENINNRCDCKMQVSYMMQCRHEVCLHGKFNANYFAICHHRRKRVIGSTSGWIAPRTDDDECISSMDNNIQDNEQSTSTDSSDDESTVESFDDSTSTDNNPDPLYLQQSIVKPITKHIIVILITLISTDLAN